MALNIILIPCDRLPEYFKSYDSHLVENVQLIDMALVENQFDVSAGGIQVDSLQFSTLEIAFLVAIEEKVALLGKFDIARVQCIFCSGSENSIWLSPSLRRIFHSGFSKKFKSEFAKVKPEFSNVKLRFIRHVGVDFNFGTDLALVGHELNESDLCRGRQL